MKSMIGSKGFRAAIIIAILGLLAAGLLVSPVGAALNKKKVKGLATAVVNQLTFTESEADARFVNVGEVAGDAQMVDGLDSTAFVKNADSFTRHWSCPGTGFWPDASDTDWSTGSPPMRFNDGGGSGVFHCAVHLPDGAVVTAIDFSVYDGEAGDVDTLSLTRTNLVGPPVAEVLADAGATSGTPGFTVLSDTSISGGTIDNDAFSYFFSARLGGLSGDNALVGATVTYTITAAQGGG